MSFIIVFILAFSAMSFIMLISAYIGDQSHSFIIGGGGFILGLLAFYFILNTGEEISKKLKQKESPKEVKNTIKFYTEEEQKVKWEKYAEDNKKSDRIGCLIWIIVPIAAVIIKSIFTGGK